MNISALLKQPTTIKGIGAVAGVVASFLAHLSLRDTTTTVAAGGLVYGLVQIIMPDNSAAPASIEKLAIDAVTAIIQKKLSASIPLLVTDALSVVGTMQMQNVAQSNYNNQGLGMVGAAASLPTTTTTGA